MHACIHVASAEVGEVGSDCLSWPSPMAFNRMARAALATSHTSASTNSSITCANTFNT